jgi:hypothetical protein
VSRSDRELRDALRRLRVPDHAAGFVSGLRQALDKMDAEKIGGPEPAESAGSGKPSAAAGDADPAMGMGTAMGVTGVVAASGAAAGAAAGLGAPPESPSRPAAESPREAPPESRPAPVRAPERSVKPPPPPPPPPPPAVIPETQRRPAPPAAEEGIGMPVEGEAAPVPAVPESPERAVAEVPTELPAAEPPVIRKPRQPTAEGRRPLYRRPLTWILSLMLVAALAAAAILATPRDEAQESAAVDSGSVDSTAPSDDVRTLMATSLATTTSYRGVLVVGLPGPDGESGALREMRWNIAATASGDYRLIGNNSTAEGSLRTDAIAYSAQDGAEKTYGREGDAAPVADERTGLAAGAPDPGPSGWVVQTEFGSIVRVVLAADDPDVTEDTYEERPAWVLTTDVDAALLPGGAGDRVELTVDRATAFPVRARVLLDETAIQEYRLEELELDLPLTRGQFNMTFPEGVEATTSDNGFARVPDPVSVVGYTPLEPSWLPDGFVPSLSVVASEAAATGRGSSNPTSLSVVSSLYTRGFDEIVISTRSVGDDPAAWSNPFAGLDGFGDDTQTVDLEAGAFAGSEAEVSDEDALPQYLWAVNDTLVVTATGHVSRSDLVAIVESLEDGSQ